MDSENLTLTDKLAADVADAVLSGAFAPGARLDEHSLAERYGVSRTPVREALRQLAATGLIEMRPRRGAVVAAVTARTARRSLRRHGGDGSHLRPAFRHRHDPGVERRAGCRRATTRWRSSRCRVTRRSYADGQHGVSLGDLRGSA